MEIKQKVDEMHSAFEAFKKANDAEIAALKAGGQVPADLKEKTEKLNTEISRLEGEIKAISTAMARKQVVEEANEAKARSEHSKAMNSYLRKGNDQAVQKLIETKAMSSDSDADGGYFVSPEMSSEIVRQVYETTPMRQVASVQTISSNALDIMQDLGRSTSGWVGEIADRPVTATPQWNKLEIAVHELYSQPSATQRLLDDAEINIESWLAGKVTEDFALQENSAFVSGNGVSKPMGFLSYVAGTAFGQVEQITTASSGTITGDDIYDYIAALKTAYVKNASFLMNRKIIAYIRKLKGSDGQYLWQPGLNGPSSSQLAGYPIVEAPDMASAVATSALAMAFGDWKQGYQIVDRIGIRVLRDVYTSKPYIKFYTTKRVGGGVKNFEALKILKVHA